MGSHSHPAGFSGVPSPEERLVLGLLVQVVYRAFAPTIICEVWLMSDEERVDMYVDMWTTDLNQYALIELERAHPSRCVIKDLSTGGLVVIDDDEQVVSAVIMNMRKAGVRVMSPEEARPK